jgi:hypothetical protein
LRWQVEAALEVDDPRRYAERRQYWLPTVARSKRAAVAATCASRSSWAIHARFHPPPSFAQIHPDVRFLGPACCEA